MSMYVCGLVPPMSVCRYVIVIDAMMDTYIHTYIYVPVEHEGRASDAEQFEET
jgi:hypothetical protein